MSLRRSLHRAGGNRGGFTLLELAVVLFLAALLAAIVAPSLEGPVESARLRAGAAEVRSALARARYLAVEQGRVRSVTFDLGRGEFGVAGEEAPRPLPEGVRFESLRVAGRAPDSPAVGFFPDGGSVEARIDLSSPSGGRIRVTVDPLTGMAEAGS